MPRENKKAAKIVSMPPRKKARTLATSRLVALIRQKLTNEYQNAPGAQRNVAKDLGIDSTLPSKLLGDPFRNVDAQTIETIVQVVGIDPRFFSDASLGADPDYREFLTSSDARGSGQAKPSGPSRLFFVGAGVSVQLTPDAAAELDHLNASAEERAEFYEVLNHYRFPFVNKSHVQTFLGGLRKGKPLPQRIDDALNASIAEEARKRKTSAKDDQ